MMSPRSLYDTTAVLSSGLRASELFLILPSKATRGADVAGASAAAAGRLSNAVASVQDSANVNSLGNEFMKIS